MKSYCHWVALIAELEITYIDAFKSKRRAVPVLNALETQPIN